MAGDVLTEPRKTGTRSLVVNLRKVAKDKRSTPAQRLRACELLREMELETRREESQRTERKANKLRDLLEPRKDNERLGEQHANAG